MAHEKEPLVGQAAVTAEFMGRVADLAGRLAAALCNNAPDGGGPFAAAVDFLKGTVAWAGDRVVDPTAVTPFDRLERALRLSAVDVDLVLLAGLAEEHEGLADLFRSLHPRGEPRPTVAVALQLLCRDVGERHALGNAILRGPAARSGLLALDGAGPFPTRNLLLADSIWHVLQGFDVWPAALAVEQDPVPVQGLEDWLDRPEVAAARRLLAGDEPVTLLVFGEDDVPLHRTAALAAHAGVAHARLRLGADPGAGMVRLAQIHALARGAVPIIQHIPGDGPATSPPPSFHGYPRPAALCARPGTPIPRGARPVVAIDAGPLLVRARARLWERILPELASEAGRLGGRYPLEPALAVQVVADARATASARSSSGDSRATFDDVTAAVRLRSVVGHTAAVRVIRATATWDHLVLRPERKQILREAVDRLLHQERVLDEWRFLEGRPGARSVRMLFAGPPGTGKTLSAEVIANTLGVDLLVVDISQLVSKWIGETEKNLAQVFAAAERSTAVLLFDEADAIFGKRTRVTDAHDRYANLETAYLLARLERFEGLAILSTNQRDNIDPAFLRRIEFVVDFETPSVEEREALWRRHVPPQAPVADDVSYSDLAVRYPIVGGLIRNAAVAAAFLAATDDQPIRLRHIMQAVRREYEKSGRSLSDLTV